jgi:hypothetical protein
MTKIQSKKSSLLQNQPSIKYLVARKIILNPEIRKSLISQLLLLLLLELLRKRSTACRMRRRKSRKRKCRLRQKSRQWWL